MAPMPGALERCVGDVRTFAADHWGRTPLHRRTDEPFDDVLSVDDIDALLTSAARRPEVRLVRDGTTLDPRAYTSMTRLGGRSVDDLVDPTKVADRMAEGATVVLQSVHRTWPAVSRFAAELEQQVSHPVQVNVYVTPPGAAGLAPHSDEHDVIVCQLHGHKAWTVDGLGELTLSPGNTMYLPTGTRHSATAQDQASVHLTIGLLRITYRDVVQRLLARSSGVLDQPLPLGWAADSPTTGFEDALATALEHAGKALDVADVSEVADRERRRRRPRPEHGGRIASTIRAADIDGSTIVRLRPGTAPTVEDGADGALRLQLSDRRLRLPAVARAALEVLCAGSLVRVDELPSIDAESRLVLARRLVREGMLLVAPA
ncbi:MAG: cupin [Acidimicrobiia bacterium]|nr:cupin [Acidimicrobiia bacterium]